MTQTLYYNYFLMYPLVKESPEIVFLNVFRFYEHKQQQQAKQIKMKRAKKKFFKFFKF